MTHASKFIVFFFLRIKFVVDVKNTFNCLEIQRKHEGKGKEELIEKKLKLI